mmetsp:Transcript_7094/g.15649  ORF Transcript_7094/g.15649 Transcript_7094/m.15649 type:complete len:281 (-) Transcript_7094:611-1453(-)
MLQRIQRKFRTRLAHTSAEGFVTLQHRDGMAIGARHIDAHGVRFTDIVRRRHLQKEIRRLHQRPGEVGEKLTEPFRSPKVSGNEGHEDSEHIVPNVRRRAHGRGGFAARSELRGNRRRFRERPGEDGLLSHSSSGLVVSEASIIGLVGPFFFGQVEGYLAEKQPGQGAEESPLSLFVLDHRLSESEVGDVQIDVSAPAQARREVVESRVPYAGILGADPTTERGGLHRHHVGHARKRARRQHRRQTGSRRIVVHIERELQKVQGVRNIHVGAASRIDGRS